MHNVLECKKAIEEIENNADGFSPEFYILLESVIDPEIEKQKLTEELNYQEGFLISVRKKLENEKFRLNAKPEIIAAEEKKQQDSESRIRVIKDRLKEL
jgi:valyl-tRNA synthetase